ncbi:P-loop containing nucleoside triphosphate hydrolase protein [Guyanagaster necrorhizus]|uniref:P-loop containing nucleoside triphosphate hydrolase protein n=1 Tax=Guyanagaster necrorhizus TaxID=856835 RepID=A0A9P7VFN5_9AGAR|nr:P-loop containing nucleoside triphosphate hydrolase protein [Guyanagaster necrorhizus MCA 3950]KAG7439707.1 P-loop containing nucleoside triphosphate hydrolase protein [Guyanagaster necrorhizus MCA 3950]
MVVESVPHLAAKADQRQLETITLGIWKVSSLKSTPFNIRKQFSDLGSAFPYFFRLAVEVYTLEPVLAIMFVLNKLWKGVEGALLLYFSSRILRIIEIGLVQGAPDMVAILNALTARISCVVLAAILQWASEQVIPTLKTRVTTHFELYLMQAELRIDVPTSQKPRSKFKASSYNAWTSFEGIVEFVTQVMKAFSQFTLILQASNSTGSSLFTALCVMKPVFLALSRRSLWDIPHIVYTDNEHRKRMKALNFMTSPGYRSEILAGDLIGYIINEYRKAAALLGGLSDDWAPNQYMNRKSPMWHVVTDLMGDLPMVYCAIVSILHPEELSLSSIAILQQSSQTLEWTLQVLSMNVNSFRKQYQEIKNVYDSAKTSTKLQDGNVSYPRTSKDKYKGMSFELRDVSFTYPGSQNTKPTLFNINLSIESGQLVVIVGANGSGKSTVLKLLSRFYDPSSAPDSILVDGLPISRYRMQDLRRATATLTQDHSLFPLSLGENIGLGYAERAWDAGMVDRAAETGGATHCLRKLQKGKNTKLDMGNEAYGHNVPDEPTHPLQVELEKLQKNISLSGGETQRVVAARTFMRLESGTVNFVAVDEPSSALDPEGEAALFRNLIRVRQGKTMIFVTHRFGHLTKHADLVVCMKDGTIAEAGTHVELISRDGEYAKLYNIQASAFFKSGST